MTDDSLSDEDKALFREQMRSVKPLKKSVLKNQDKAPSVKPLKPISPKERKYPAVKPEKNYFLSDYISEPVQSHSVLSYAQASLPSKRFKALRNGQIPWEARLDLHGLQAEKAKDALCHFISTQLAQNRRCLLIIHGKGGQEGAAPVIKNLVNRWLPQMEEVLAFHSALAKDGGYGALYVLLKKYQD
ncbi:Smr/MutS family protein [Legionella sp. km772]|uniref:Smr/MutS family protein n=1 Tax=Legionella sp. km772 TaxID=2498111 RepID=UPI000F8EB203|nr:Smr/MutS family protein [Legionella sp. km772]RUR09281.1 DNA mismatch repair protein MutS [Legionella sp. km772]